MNLRITIPIYCVGIVFVIVGFIIDSFTNPQQHSAFSPLGITFYAIGAIVLAIGVICMLRFRKN